MAVNIFQSLVNCVPVFYSAHWCDDRLILDETSSDFKQYQPEKFFYSGFVILTCIVEFTDQHFEKASDVVSAACQSPRQFLIKIGDFTESFGNFVEIEAYADVSE